MRVLLLGAGGMLAREIRAQAPPEQTIVAFTRSDLDVTDRDAVRRTIHDAQPEWVINASGFTDVDEAEVDRDVAFAVNATAVGELGAICRSERCGVLHFSTDYVFDGQKDGFYTEDDEPRPLSVYGASKLEGEKLLRASGARHLLIRTQWLYGGQGKSFISALGQRARDRVTTRAVADQCGCCTYVVDLAQVIWLALGRLEGTYHVANRGRVSRYDIGRHIFAAYGIPELLTPCSHTDFPRAAARPANSAMSVVTIERALSIRMAHWMDAIERYLDAAAPARSAGRL